MLTCSVDLLILTGNLNMCNIFVEKSYNIYCIKYIARNIQILMTVGHIYMFCTIFLRKQRFWWFLKCHCFLTAFWPLLEPSWIWISSHGLWQVCFICNYLSFPRVKYLLNVECWMLLNSRTAFSLFDFF